MLRNCCSCFPPISSATPTTRGTTPLNDAERGEPASPLAEDFARAQQAAVQASVAAGAPPMPMTPNGIRASAALAPVPVFRTSSAPAAPSRPSSTNAPIFTIDLSTGPGATNARRIADALWRDVAIPALQALETSTEASEWDDRLAPLEPPDANERAWSVDASEPGSLATQPWCDTLRAHLHWHARTLALHGLDVAAVSERFETLLREQRPGFSWRSFCIGTLRDAMPFAVGSTLASLLAESTDPTRSQAWLWPPLAALTIIGVNLLGMAGFNATQLQYRNRIERTTPAPDLEGLSAILSTPYRAAFAQVLGFVLCYGVLRNGARYGVERAISNWFPGILTRRFGDTLHASLEIPLAPVPGILLLPIIHRMGTTRHNASLQILTQDNLAELLIDTPQRDPLPREWRAYLHDIVQDLSDMLRSAPPRLIWFALMTTFYYLAWIGDGLAHGHGSTNATAPNDSPTAHNATLDVPGTVSSSLSEEAHVFAVLDVLYGVIGLIFSIGHSAAQREDIRTAHERRAPRPKISTCTVVTMADSGVSSVSSMSMRRESPRSVSPPEMNNNSLTSTRFPFPASHTPDAFSPPAALEHRDVQMGASRRPAGIRRHGTTTPPRELRTLQHRPRWPSVSSDGSDDDTRLTTPL
ncbi:hypothetical protein [Pandoraea sp.]|uniref:hypothetical protein n=1 Tax=Pandoraea sp. TaxID=1883445 RepID=UPI0035B46F40